jgi:glycosyltransferase involved in cell wall biosynthesis
MSIENKKVSIVIPAYNEEHSIGKILEDLQSLNTDFEILVIDDGSTDKTAQVAETYNIRVIRHPVNKGYGAALKTGFRNAEGEYILIIDADGQHKVKDITRLLEFIGPYDMVVGARTKKSKISLNRKLAQYVMKKTANYLSGQDIPDLNSGFRVMKKEPVLENIHILPNGFSFTTTITLAMLMGGYNLKYVPIETESRIGSSKIRPFRDGVNFILLILRTVSLFNPLKVFLPISALLMTLGIIDLLYEVIRYFNVSSASILLITSSIIIFFFGLLADQISAIRRMNK